MNMLEKIPLLSTVLGLLICVFILLKKSDFKNDKKIRYTLVSLIFLYAYTSFDCYLALSAIEVTSFTKRSYLFYHFIGFFLFYLIMSFSEKEMNIKKWILICIGYTLLRWETFHQPPDNLYFSLISQFIEEPYYYNLIRLDFLITSIVNIGLSVFSFYRLKEIPLLSDDNNNESIHYKWVKSIVVGFVIIQIGVIINGFLCTFDFDNYKLYMMYESIFYFLFFIFLILSILRFPVFKCSGNFNDLLESTSKKYAKSSLSDSLELFYQIENIVKEEKLFFDPNLKLNTLSEILEDSVHHISQAINQNAQISFSDYINNLRIEEAKRKLMQPNPDTVYAIALDVGFNRKAAFYSVFKKFNNQTPSEFKNSYKVLLQT